LLSECIAERCKVRAVLAADGEDKFLNVCIFKVRILFCDI
jgi:hypothetical protein